MAPRWLRGLRNKLRVILDEEEASVFTTEMLGRAAPTLRDLDELGGEWLAFVEPASFDDRTVKQLRVIFLDARRRLQRALEEWLKAGDLARKLVVPAKLKWEVRDKLDQANVTERVLYPGLDGLTRWLTRYYTPREPP